MLYMTERATDLSTRRISPADHDVRVPSLVTRDIRARLAVVLETSLLTRRIPAGTGLREPGSSYHVLAGFEYAVSSREELEDCM
jgi:hypothetical protein